VLFPRERRRTAVAHCATPRAHDVADRSRRYEVPPGSTDTATKRLDVRLPARRAGQDVGSAALRGVVGQDLAPATAP